MYTALYRREGRARAGVGVGEQALRHVGEALLDDRVVGVVGDADALSR